MLVFKLSHVGKWGPSILKQMKCGLGPNVPVFLKGLTIRKKGQPESIPYWAKYVITYMITLQKMIFYIYKL